MISAYGEKSYAKNNLPTQGNAGTYPVFRKYLEKFCFAARRRILDAVLLDDGKKLRVI